MRRMNEKSKSSERKINRITSVNQVLFYYYTLLHVKHNVSGYYAVSVATPSAIISRDFAIAFYSSLNSIYFYLCVALDSSLSFLVFFRFFSFYFYLRSAILFVPLSLCVILYRYTLTAIFSQAP